jgi:hypothetical protein
LSGILTALQNWMNLLTY